MKDIYLLLAYMVFFLIIMYIMYRYATVESFPVPQHSSYVPNKLEEL